MRRETEGRERERELMADRHGGSPERERENNVVGLKEGVAHVQSSYTAPNCVMSTSLCVLHPLSGGGVWLLKR